MTTVEEIVGPVEGQLGRRYRQTITLLDGVDVGEQVEPGVYDWWFDRYFLTPVDPSVKHRVPPDTELRYNGRSEPQLVLQHVEYRRRDYLADGRLQLGEMAEWEQLMAARRSPQPVFSSDPGSLWVAPVSSVTVLGDYWDRVTGTPCRGYIRFVRIYGEDPSVSFNATLDVKGHMSASLGLGTYLVKERLKRSHRSNRPPFFLEFGPDSPPVYHLTGQSGPNSRA